MTIPKGLPYSFIITVIEKDSFLPQDLTNMNVPTSSFKLVGLSDLCDVTTGTVTLTVTDAINGKVQVDLDSTLTDSLTYLRGEAVDNYYLKPVYQGVINIKFTDATPERTAIIEKVYVAPTGVVCA